MWYGNGVLGKETGRQKFHVNCLSKYFIPKIYNEIPGKGQLCFTPTTFLNNFFKNI